MNQIYIDFEEPIVKLKEKILDLELMQQDSSINLNDEINQLQDKLTNLTKEIFSNLTPWQIAQVARHTNRPRSLDYIKTIFTNWVELHGDRHFYDDKSIIGGMAKLGDQTVMVIAQQKGKNTKENLERNFGMPKPEGYRKALRLMKLAEKFHLPVFTFVDTPGAYPGIGSEERNQSEAIGRNIYEMCLLKTPIITTIIGEGGSGGALALAVADQVNMLEFAIYSVITPEGCASILWKDASKAFIAADILGISASKLKQLGIIDSIINEPLGGAHNNFDEISKKLRTSLKIHLKKIQKFDTKELLERRYLRMMNYGKYSEFNH